MTPKPMPLSVAPVGTKAPDARAGGRVAVQEYRMLHCDLVLVLALQARAAEVTSVTISRSTLP